MYNFNAHTLNGLPVNYSQIPNFALDTVETDTRLNANAKLVYIRLLRYATLLKKTAFKITASWLSDHLATDRHTIARALKSLKECGYLDDNGIILVTGANLDTPVTLVNDHAMNAPKQQQQPPKNDDVEAASFAISAIHEILGMRRKSPPTTVDNGTECTNSNVAECTISPKNDVAKCAIVENGTVQNATSMAQNATSEWHKMHHPIKNKGENKEKNDCTNQAETNGQGFDYLATVSNQYKTDSVTDLVTVTTTKANDLGKIIITTKQAA